MKTLIHAAILFFSLQVSFLNAQLNWVHTNGPEGGAFYTLITDSIYTYAADSYHLFRTGDGLSWESIPQGNLWPMASSNEKLAAGQGYGYSFKQGTVPKFVVSNDHGATWIEGMFPPVSSEYFNHIAVCSHGIYVPDGVNGLVFRTQDDGLTWDTLVAPQLYAYEIYGAEDKLFLTSLKKFWQLAPNGTDWLLISPDFGPGQRLMGMYAVDSVILFATDDFLWASKDNGANWTKTPGENPYEWGHFVQIGHRIYKANGYQNLVCTDDFGENWIAYPISEFVTSITDIGTAGGTLLGTNWRTGVFRLDENEQKFVPANEGLNSASVLNLNAGNNQLWAACNGGVFAYDLTQQTWVDKALLPLKSYQKAVVSPQGKIAAFHFYDREIYLSSDNGASWDTLELITPSGSSDQVLNIFWIEEKLYASFNFSGFHYTPDLGANWQPAIAMRNVMPFQGKYYGINFQGELMVSLDNGASWQAVAAPPVPFCARIFTTADRLFVITRGDQWQYTLFYSMDGIDWHYANDGLPRMPWEPNDVAFTDGYYGGIWQVSNRYFLHNYSGNLFASLDSCKTWLPISREEYFNMEVIDSTLYAGASDGGMLMSAPPQNYGALSTGIVYNDLNNNGARDPGEAPLPGTKVSVFEPGAWFNTWYTQAKSDGSYSIGSMPGSVDTLRVLLNSPYILNIQPGHYLVSGSGANRDFGIHFMSNIMDVSVQGGLAGRPRPGFNLYHMLDYRNEGTLESSGIVSVKLDPHFQFQNANPAPTAIIGTDSLVWDFTQMPLFTQRNIWILGTVSVSAPLGSPYTIRAHIEPSLTDQQPANNHWTLTDTIVGSFDPNEKRVEPARGLTAQEIAEGKELLYTIHFQNTGTFQADRVRITDLLDTALNAATLRLVAASHTVTGFQLLPGNLIEVVFDQIHLPDSNANEPASHGFVIFAIQRNKAFEPSHIVRNNAAIYFDFNEPIITNTVKTPLYVPEAVSITEPGLGVGFNTLHIAPNPASTEFRVYTRGALSGAGQINLFNAEGKPFQTLQVPDTGVPVNIPIRNVPPGMYFIQVKDVQEQMWGKILIKR